MSIFFVEKAHGIIRTDTGEIDPPRAEAFLKRMGSTSREAMQLRCDFAALARSTRAGLADLLVKVCGTQRWQRNRALRASSLHLLHEMSAHRDADANTFGIMLTSRFMRNGDTIYSLVAAFETTSALSDSYEEFDKAFSLYCHSFKRLGAVINEIARMKGADFRKLAFGTPDGVKAKLLQTLLPFGEEALAVATHLLIIATRDADSHRFATIQKQAHTLATELNSWAQYCATVNPSVVHDEWHQGLMKIVGERLQQRTMADFTMPSSQTTKALDNLITEVREDFAKGLLSQADAKIFRLISSLKKNGYAQLQGLHDYELLASYIRIQIRYTYAQTSTAEKGPHSHYTLRKEIAASWQRLEATFKHSNIVWSKAVVNERATLEKILPESWRFVYPQMPI